MNTEGLPDIINITANHNHDALLAQLAEKQQLKQANLSSKYVFLTAKKLFMESLSKDASLWPSPEQENAKLSAANKEFESLQDQIMDVKYGLNVLFSPMEEAIQVFVEKKELLEKQKMELAAKKAELATLKKELGAKKETMISKPKTVENEIVKRVKDCYNVSLNKIQVEITSTSENIGTMEEILRANCGGTSIEQMDVEDAEEVLKQRVTDVVETMTTQGGLRIVQESPSHLFVEFADCQNVHTATQLILNLEFTLKCGSAYLNSAQINIDTIDAHQLIKDAITTNNVPLFVTKLSALWTSHQPLLSEISQLQKNFAIDWMQEDHLLRVIVGRGGQTMCSLSLPPGYPKTGEVTLQNININGDAISAGEVKELQISGPDRSLTSWVNFLQTKFGQL